MVNHRDSFGSSSFKIPFFYPSISVDDKKAISNALDLPLLTDGPKLLEFESKFARLAGTKYAIGVSNATSALHISLKSLGIGKNDEVIIPDMTFIATASSVLLTGATPILADVEKSDMNISVESVKKSITPKTKAILPVHFAGKVCNITEIMNIAKKYNLEVIEDCAHAIGARYQNKHVGTFGTAGCFSFYPTKNITTIEGGMVITNSKEIAKNIRSSRNHGITRTLRQRYTSGKPWEYDVNEPGYNYRLDEIRSTLGINQLKRIEMMNYLRRESCMYYNLKLKDVKGIVIPTFDRTDVYHLYIIRITNEYKLKRDHLFKRLLKKGIMTSVHYKPIHKFTVFKKNAVTYDKLENSKKLYEQIISLPLYVGITRRLQDKVIDAIIDH